MLQIEEKKKRTKHDFKTQMRKTQNPNGYTSSPPSPTTTTTKETGNHNLATLMSIFVVVLMMVTSLAKAQTLDCASQLVPCADDLNSTDPRISCCNSLREAMVTQLPCVCALYTSPAVLKSFGITVDQVLNLNGVCGVSTDLSPCNGIFLPFLFVLT